MTEKEAKKLKSNIKSRITKNYNGVLTSGNSAKIKGVVLIDDALKVVNEEIDNLPPVTPARKKGQWLQGCPIAVDGGLARQIKWSECGDERIDFFAVSKNYCSKCGAKME